VAPLLRFAAPVDEGRAQQVEGARRRQYRSAGAKILLVEDDLLHDIGTAPAIFPAPGDADPAGGAHPFFAKGCAIPGSRGRRRRAGRPRRRP
jgi:hypothetical protein